MDRLPKRKTPRHQSFDYNSIGVYFITVCTQNRRGVIFRVVGTGVLDCPKTELTEYSEKPSYDGFFCSDGALC